MPGSYNAGDLLQAANLATPAWKTLTLLNGWANTDIIAQYRFHPLLNLIEVIGHIQGSTANNANGTILASGLTPTVHSQTNVGIMIDTSGNLVFESNPATLVYFHLFFSTDA
jgi:hypothetical protein